MNDSILEWFQEQLAAPEPWFEVEVEYYELRTERGALVYYPAERTVYVWSGLGYASDYGFRIENATVDLLRGLYGE